MPALLFFLGGNEEQHNGYTREIYNISNKLNKTLCHYFFS